MSQGTNQPQMGILADVDSIMDIFIACTDTLLAAGIQQWNYTYPTPNVIQQDIQKKELFVIKEGEQCLATITLNTIQDAQYKGVKWAFPSDKVLVIHRLAVHPKAQGRGLGKQLCNFTEQYGFQNDYEVIRLDAYSKNMISNTLYKKLDYQLADGFCYFHDNIIPFYCYEKRIIEKEDSF